MTSIKTQAPPASSSAIRFALEWGSAVRYLKGVGPEKQRLLARLGLERLSDLFYFFPRRYEKRFPVKKISELTYTDKECVAGQVTGCSVVRRGRGGAALGRVVVSDGRRSLTALYYRQPYLKDVFQLGRRVLFYGKAEKTNGQAQMTHPEYEFYEGNEPSEMVHTGRWTPVYPLTEDLSQKTMRHLLHRAVHEHLALARDPLPEPLRNQRSLPVLQEALRGIHFPKDVDDLLRAHRRLVFDEFFALELAVEMKRAKWQKENRSMPHTGGEESLRRWKGSLEFALTAAQQKAIDDIVRDLQGGRHMHRLVQGDVGSGKTVVAAAALYYTVLNGHQGALMAPTEVLAQQLYFQMKQFLEPFGVRCVYLSQSVDPVQKQKIWQEIVSGQAQVAVGTHALISDKVRFPRLGLAVVDEQHKFGVFQRAALQEKNGAAPHLLLMTATPIPRTLAMTLYGDLDVSIIHERPKGPSPVRTLWVEEERRAAVYRWLDGFVAQGAQAYVICPQVDAGASGGLKNATEQWRELSHRFPQRRLGLLHGRLSAADKKKVMKDFKDKKTDILVSTVVVEVGVDISSARCMIIENAERFGLAQLHQLRGRVGRGREESFCLLFSSTNDPDASERLSLFENTSSGFDIAEKDLEQRGAGEYFGQKQHGLLRFRIGDLVKDRELFLKAREEAKAMIAEDPFLEKPVHRALRRLVLERFADLSKVST